MKLSTTVIPLTCHRKGPRKTDELGGDELGVGGILLKKHAILDQMGQKIFDELGLEKN